jgi:hypothetical protein
VTATLPAGWHADHPAPITWTELFIGDGGAVYDLIGRADGTVDAYAAKTRTRYSSLLTDLVITGKKRAQPGTGGMWGRRARLTLDTGEGLSQLGGFVRG